MFKSGLHLFLKQSGVTKRFCFSTLMVASYRMITNLFNGHVLELIILIADLQPPDPFLVNRFRVSFSSFLKRHQTSECSLFEHLTIGIKGGTGEA